MKFVFCVFFKATLDFSFQVDASFIHDSFLMPGMQSNISGMNAHQDLRDWWRVKPTLQKSTAVWYACYCILMLLVRALMGTIPTEITEIIPPWNPFFYGYSELSCIHGEKTGPMFTQEHDPYRMGRYPCPLRNTVDSTTSQSWNRITLSNTLNTSQSEDFNEAYSYTVISHKIICWSLHFYVKKPWCRLRHISIGHSCVCFA